MKTARKLHKRKFKNLSKNNRKGGRLFGYPTNPFKAIANRTGVRKSRDQITRENLLFGMAPIKDYDSIVAAKMIPFEEHIETVDRLVTNELDELKELIPQCRRECLIAIESKDPDVVDFSKKMDFLTFCGICSIPPYEISICQDVEAKRKTIEAYINVIKGLLQKYEENLALLRNSKEEDE